MPCSGDTSPSEGCIGVGNVILVHASKGIFSKMLSISS